ncbi:MAG: anti-sigma factor antagonist [Eubacteriales bacterium]|jgi:stage II sporulation protein AA (anti-sigma F factor antagonist)|nr:anti-sigma factor antagonist [Clostridiales bacterium]MDD7396243.1 anti-sigma factor antagonist [Eubacteriales bacterium]MDY2983487.1 anti-sigma factor antagonist [Eubacteriales bacterium]
MEIHASKKGPRMHARLCGELDHHSAEQARNMLDTMLHDITIRDLTLDLSGVTFMDSAGLGVILGRYRILSLRGGKLTVCGMSSAIDRIFRMSGLYAIVDRQ